MVSWWISGSIKRTPSFEGGDQLASIEAIQFSTDPSLCYHSGPQHLRQGFAPALAASCCLILVGTASNKLGLTVTAGIVMVPVALGIAKAVVFLREKEMGLLGIS